MWKIAMFDFHDVNPRRQPVGLIGTEHPDSDQVPGRGIMIHLMAMTAVLWTEK